MQRVGTEILTAVPLDTALEGFDGVEDTFIFQFLKNSNVQVRRDIESLNFAIRKDYGNGVIWIGFNCLDSWIHARFRRRTPAPLRHCLRASVRAVQG